MKATPATRALSMPMWIVREPRGGPSVASASAPPSQIEIINHRENNKSSQEQAPFGKERISLELSIQFSVARRFHGKMQSPSFRSISEAPVPGRQDHPHGNRLEGDLSLLIYLRPRTSRGTQMTSAPFSRAAFITTFSPGSRESSSAALKFASSCHSAPGSGFGTFHSLVAYTTRPVRRPRLIHST
jgi:hypothetical protein